LRNAAVGVQRAIARLRPGTGRRSTATVTIQRRTVSMAHPLRTRSIGVPRPSRERLVQLSAVGLVGVAVALSSVGPSAVASIGNTFGAGSEPRIAVGGGVDGGGWHDVAADGFAGGQATAEGNVGGDSSESPISGGRPPDDRVTVDRPLSDDGIFVEVGSGDTVAGNSSAAIRTYRVRSGDTLTGIAAKFDVSMMTVWWANHLKSKDDLRIGQALTIPVIDGLVVTVAAGDTLETLATKYHLDAVDIVAANSLVDRNLVAGQKLIIPGARAAQIRTPKPAPRSKPSPAPASTVRPPAQYTGGTFAWPVAGGQISQYFHYGHYALDIAADSGSRVLAAAGGTVIFAGWKNNGGGYQVWIAHGSNLYTTYNHMSSISVGRGQHVSRSQQVGRVGMTGNATGPHLHFEVWRGMIWDGGTRVNPLPYL
jgi:murein DD-endopeptidase MepM/ murein hydrolase activator NlpD